MTKGFTAITARAAADRAVSRSQRRSVSAPPAPSTIKSTARRTETDQQAAVPYTARESRKRTRSSRDRPPFLQLLKESVEYADVKAADCQHVGRAVLAKGVVDLLVQLRRVAEQNAADQGFR